MAILKKKNSTAAAGSILVITDGADLCCGDEVRKDYVTAEFDATTADISHVNVTVPGGSAQSIALAGALDMSTSTVAQETAFREHIETVVTDLGFEMFDGGIELIRGATNDLLTIRIKDSTLQFNWIGVATTFENAFTATNSVP